MDQIYIQELPKRSRKCFPKMVVHLMINHLYRYPVELVMKTHLTKYPTEAETHVLSVQEVERKLESSGMEYRRRIATCTNIIPCIFRKIAFLDEPAVFIEEEYWLDKRGRRYFVRSRNITWADTACLYESSTFVADEANPGWTQFEQHGAVEIKGLGRLGHILEIFTKTFLSGKMKSNITLMETLLKQNAERYLCNNNDIPL